ncbi:sensor domain-containing diguanylate cyclase [Thalassotalea euphylliae]|uniref:diguanylate cyclase n=1 Tax=Thalassotalea euphylliae TaxID=1655234 RepID=A0A3E0TSW5_9GAMM|nr:sensor domain-containing diguanylate cyclase [Thalassotalea euphylliae]REL27510.1 sensor domain-containing diguanylate cyclase [Thalassotalea euphylliae]
MWFQKLLSIGTAHQTFSVTNKVRMMNLIAAITTLVSGLYTLAYALVLDNTAIALINTVFTCAYMATLAFNYFQAFRGGKIWFFATLMLHLVVCTNLYVTKASGFHLYFFLVPTGVFLLFELSEKTEKVTLSLMALVLYFYCENTVNPAPLIVLSDSFNHVLYQSVILVIMLEVILVLTLFANEIEANELKLTKQATTDALTGLANRHAFFECGNHLFNSTQHMQRPLTIVLVDIDYFKQINDQYGHFVGDVCLTQVTKLLSRFCREQDMPARIGGEEFAIIMPDTTASEANNIAEQMRIAIAALHIPVAGEQHFKCTASFGLASAQAHRQSLKDTLIHADKALYLAKELGRNRVQSYQAS